MRALERWCFGGFGARGLDVKCQCPLPIIYNFIMQIDINVYDTHSCILHRCVFLGQSQHRSHISEVLEPCQVFQLRFGYRKFENDNSPLLVCSNWFLPWACWDFLELLDLQKFLGAVPTTWDPNSMLEMKAFCSLHEHGFSVIILLLWVMRGYCNMQ